MNSSSNNTTSATEHSLVNSPKITVFDLVSFIVITAVVLPIGIVGNVLVILVVKKKRYLHTSTNIFLANLAASDLMANVLGYPATAVRVFPLESKTFGSVVCKINSYYPAASFCSILTLTVVAVERYNAIVKPLSVGLVFNKRTRTLLIAFIWILSLLVVTPLVIYDEYAGYECHRSWSKTAQIEFWTTGTILCIFLPLLVIIYCYFRIIRTLYFGCRIVPMNIPIEVDAKEKKKVIKLSIVVTAVFSFSFLPFAIVRQLQVRQTVPRSVSVSSLILIMLSSLLNPFIYAFQSTNFRKAFKEAMVCNLKI